MSPNHPRIPGLDQLQSSYKFEVKDATPSRLQVINFITKNKVCITDQAFQKNMPCHAHLIREMLEDKNIHRQLRHEELSDDHSISSVSEQFLFPDRIPTNDLKQICSGLQLKIKAVQLTNSNYIKSERRDSNSCAIKAFDLPSGTKIKKGLPLKNAHKTHDELNEDEFIELHKRQLGYLNSIALILRGPQASYKKTNLTYSEESKPLI